MAATDTLKIHRVFKTTPEKLYKAFLDPDALVKWFPPNGCTGKVLKMEPKVGGECHFVFINFATGKEVHSAKWKYVELIPGKRLRYINTDDPNIQSKEQVTVNLRSVMGVTELNYTQECMPTDIPVEMCYLAWQGLLENLAHIVEPVIPDGP